MQDKRVFMYNVETVMKVNGMVRRLGFYSVNGLSAQQVAEEWAERNGAQVLKIEETH